MQPENIQWEEIKLIADSYSKFWTIYVGWFTWFFGINVAAMAFLVTSYRKVTDKYLLYALCLFMATCCAIGLVAAVKMIDYAQQVAARVAFLKPAVLANTKHPIDPTLLTSEVIATPTTWLLLISIGWTLCGWLFVAAWAAGILPRTAPKNSN
jgi:hypothetical protein